MWRWSICVCGWGVGGGIKLPCLFTSLLRWLLGVTLIWRSSPQKPLPLSILFTTIAPSPNSQPVTHQWWAATKASTLTVFHPVLISHEANLLLRLLPPFLPFFSHPTPNIPISLALNGPCVPLTLRRVWGWSQSPVLLNGSFLNVHTVWPAALYSNCVNKMSNGKGHRRHRYSIGSKIAVWVSVCVSQNLKEHQASREMPLV